MKACESPRQGSVALVERALLRHARRAKREGLKIVFGAFLVAKGGQPAGCCALGAYELFAPRDERLALPVDGDALCRAWEAIETGFDGEPRREGDALHPRAWWRLGRRLRERLKPVSAQSLDGEAS